MNIRELTDIVYDAQYCARRLIDELESYVDYLEYLQEVEEPLEGTNSEVHNMLERIQRHSEAVIKMSKELLHSHDK